jgi:hypothetical protein
LCFVAKLKGGALGLGVNVGAFEELELSNINILK